MFSAITYLIANFWVLGFKTFKASTCFFSGSSIIFFCISKALPRREYVNLACSITLLYSITLLWSEGSSSSPVRYSYWSNFPDDNADIFFA